MWNDAIISSIRYLVSIIPLTVMGIVLMELFMQLGWIQKLKFTTSPFMHFAHLREEIGISFLASFGSPTAGNSMVAQLNQNGLINKKETIIASLINSFPSSFVMVRDLLPIIIILLGKTGIVYLGIVILIGFIRTAIALVFGRLLLPPKKDSLPYFVIKKKNFKEALKNSLLLSWKPLKRIIPTMVIATIIVFQLIDLGFFETISVYLKDISILQYLPPEGLPIVAAWFASNIAAYTIAGNLLNEGILTSKEILITLFTGRMLSSIVRLRFSIPYYTGIFSPKLGMQIMLFATIMQEGITLIAILFLIFL